MATLTRRQDGDAVGVRYPWYDAIWLARYVEAKAILRRVRPAALAGFVEALRPLRTRADFRERRVARPFDDAALAALRGVVAALRPADLELHEARAFGRFVVHDHPTVTALQRTIVPLASELAGEPVDVGYNFLSLYTAKGVCGVHMDSPEAKWTLDLCLAQSAPWPLHLSAPQDWPEELAGASANGAAETPAAAWAERLKGSPAAAWRACNLLPGEALFFSGSSQWHYRDPMPRGSGGFCHLVFFHFVPAGLAELVKPRNWARLFGVPELELPPASG